MGLLAVIIFIVRGLLILRPSLASAEVLEKRQLENLCFHMEIGGSKVWAV